MPIPFLFVPCSLFKATSCTGGKGISFVLSALIDKCCRETCASTCWQHHTHNIVFLMCSILLDCGHFVLVYNMFTFPEYPDVIDHVGCCMTIRTYHVRKGWNSSSVLTLWMYHVRTKRDSSSVFTLWTFHVRKKWNSSGVTTLRTYHVRTRWNPFDAITLWTYHIGRNVVRLAL